MFLDSGAVESQRFINGAASLHSEAVGRSAQDEASGCSPVSVIYSTALNSSS